MELLKNKFKIAFLKSLSVIYWLSVISFNVYSIYFISNLGSHKSPIIIYILLYLFITSIIAVLSYVIAFLPTKDSDNYWIVTSGIQLFKKKYKFVSHAKLGYFILIFDGNNAKLYEVNWFSLKYIITIDMYDYEYDHVKISTKIKLRLDKLYENRLEKIKRKEDIENKTNNLVSKWDGFLDVESRRDAKIDKIIK
jgi:hypothetical protein